MKKFIQQVTLICAGFTLAGGCGDGGLKTGNAVDNPNPQQQISVEATSSNAGVMTASVDTRGVTGPLLGYDQQGTPFVVESARASVREIEIELPGVLDCNDFDEEEVDDDENVTVQCEDDGVEIEGPMVADLVNRILTPVIPELPFPSAAYTDVRIDFESADHLPESDPLADNTFHATGRFQYDGSERTFEFLLKFSGSAFFENVAGVPFGNLGEQLRLQLDVADWFAALPITDCLDSGDLVLVDDHLVLSNGDGDCSDLENMLRDAIAGSGELED